MDEQERIDRANRFEIFLKSLEIKNLTFAGKVGLRNTYVSNLITGYRPVTGEIALQIAKVYPQLNVRWLMWGEGEMLLSKEKSVVEVVGETDATYEATTKEGLLENLLRRVEGLEEDVRELKKNK